jgi:hypothetical protein
VRVAPVLAAKLKITFVLVVPLALAVATLSQESFAAAVHAPPDGDTVNATESLPPAGPSTSEELPREYAKVSTRLRPLAPPS